MTTTRSTKRLLVLAMVVVLATTAMAAGAHATTAESDSHGELTTTGADGTLALEVTDSSDDIVTVTVSSTAADTAGFQANLSYTPTDASVESVEFEELGGVSYHSHDADTGHVFLTQSNVGAESVDEPTLATVTMTVGDDGLSGLEFVDGDSLVTDSAGEVVGETDESSAGGTAPGSGGSSGVGGGADDHTNTTETEGNDTADGDENGIDDTDGDGETDTDDGGGADDTDGTDDDIDGTDDDTDSSDDNGDDDGENADDGNDTDDSDGLAGFGIALTIVAVLAVLGVGVTVRQTRR
ncbi:hypothetical protein [Natronorubrum tibetense]|uniref:Cohesin domain-containing protein n=1 Tax=Natronorubrum tibetense GA33 TaxID=1114856 RepID=L9VG27_9EURY|nr:hypothetical protein [Natronorubrum tibetense]ELY36170.1 hypothetical protein C496_21489 [Natronorubrum tibetense GA33]